MLRRKELTFFPVRRSNHDSEAALRLLNGHPKLFAPIVTHTTPLGEIQSAFDMLESDGHNAGKVVLTL
jgi:threonine dehydrogenase-like Zn-dependent dehydrogenase